MPSTPSFGSKTQLSNNYCIDITREQIKGVKTIHKFGHNASIGTNYVPITQNSIWRTPIVLTSLELVSSDVNDTLLGTGARSVYVEGIGEDWHEVTEIVDMDGTDPVALANTYFRIVRMYVVDTGTYATAAAGSHIGTLTLQETGAGDAWASIDATDFPLGQTEIGAYTIPAGKIGYVKSIHLHVDSAKAVDIIAFQRVAADDITAPYGAMRTWGQYNGVLGHAILHPDTPFGPFPACTDVGFMGKVTIGSDGSALVDFEILLFDM